MHLVRASATMRTQCNGIDFIMRYSQAERRTPETVVAGARRKFHLSNKTFYCLRSGAAVVAATATVAAAARNSRRMFAAFFCDARTGGHHRCGVASDAQQCDALQCETGAPACLRSPCQQPNKHNRRNLSTEYPPPYMSHAPPPPQPPRTGVSPDVFASAVASETNIRTQMPRRQTNAINEHNIFGTHTHTRAGACACTFKRARVVEHGTHGIDSDRRKGAFAVATRVCAANIRAQSRQRARTHTQTHCAKHTSDPTGAGAQTQSSDFQLVCVHFAGYRNI